MAYKPSIRSSGKPRSQRTTQVITAPAPVGGMDVRSPMGNGGSNNCLYTYNLIPSELGLRVRQGYQEWQVGTGTDVRSVIPFSSTESSKDRLFVACADGIYDCTQQGATPILMTDPVDWVLTGAEAGWGVFVNYIDNGGTGHVFYADSINGLFHYDDVNEVWEVPIDITGIVMGNVNFVMVHKLRLWFGVENDGNGYYLEPDAIAGAVATFIFGTKFKHGGSLKGLYNWTVDGGLGVDDYLVALGSQGDVLPYNGSDPSQPDWSLAGSYYVGATARGGRCASQQGGNLHILSAYGLISMSDLLRGVDPRLPDSESVTAKIAPYLRGQMADKINEYGWTALNLSTEGVLAIVTPTQLSGSDIQFVYSLPVDGWGLWRDIPINCIESWHGSPYIGTKDGRVLAMNVAKDDVRLTPNLSGVNGVNVQFSILFNYSSLGSDGLFKRGVMLRPDFSSKGGVSVDTKFMYDFDISEILNTPTDAGVTGTAWDVSKWDMAVWNSGSLNTSTFVLGGAGMGRSLSLAIKGNALSGTILASVDVFYNVGGGL